MTSPLRADSYPACTMARLRRSLRPDVGPLVPLST